MGRYSTSATTVNAAQRLELRWLINQNYFKCFGKGFELYGYHEQTITWTDGNTIGLEVHNKKSEMYLQLHYTITKRSGERDVMSYKVQIMRKPANLGVGYVLFFVCPISGKCCRKLYREYGSQYFKHFTCYGKSLRIYYPVQMVSKKYSIIEKLQSKEIQLDKLMKQRNQRCYKGKPTKRYLKTLSVKKECLQLEEITAQILMENLYKV